MKIFDSRGNPTGELDRPEIAEQGGVWYEFAQPICPKTGDLILEPADEKVYKATMNYFKSQLRWKAEPIPTPTAADLKAINMRVKGDRPKWCEKGDIVWTGTCASDPLDFLCGRENYAGYRWLLEDAPVEKEPAHTSCRGCGHYNNNEAGEQSPCLGCGGDGNQFKNYTPAIPAPKVTDADADVMQHQADSFWRLHDECRCLGFEYSKDGGVTLEQDIIAFIRSLAQRAGEERYTTGEIAFYFGTIHVDEASSYNDLITLLNDTQDGIKAVTGRNK